MWLHPHISQTFSDTELVREYFDKHNIFKMEDDTSSVTSSVGEIYLIYYDSKHIERISTDLVHILYD